jgi:hypothetical protein
LTFRRSSSFGHVGAKELMKINSRSRSRLVSCSATFVCLMGILCLVRATDNNNGPSSQAKDNCTFDYYQCADGCSANQTKGLIDYDGFKTCVDQCGRELAACLKRTEAAAAGPSGTPYRTKGNPAPTASPRRGPGPVTTVPKSNPSPTPRKGPARVTTTAKGTTAATESSTTSLKNNRSKISPTPSPTPKKGHN